MIFYLLSYLGGALTILAPCILPVLPFVFARVDRPFMKSGLPLLGGMALTFAAVGTLAAVAGNWAVQANQYGRLAALALLSLMGLALIAPLWAERLGRPVVALGSRFSSAASKAGGSAENSVLPAFFTGMATGLLWAPCAGPILGLILTGAAIEGPSLRTSLLLLAYAAGAVSSLALALLAGNQVFSTLKRSLGMGEWVRKGLGVAVIAGVTAVALGLDTGLLAQLPSGSGASVEKSLFQWLAPRPEEHIPMAAIGSQKQGGADAGRFIKVQARQTLPPLNLLVEGKMPPISGAVEWLNSPPLTAEELRGKVVLIDFWTFGCINCRNALPYVREWHRKYKDQGLVVIGVHSPEFAYEKNISNVKRALGDLGIVFPVAVDNNFAIWRAFNNKYWPAHYFVDAQGRIRFHHFGEGEYEKSEQVIQQLLEEARKQAKPV
ncbi:cytochrome c biogenesis protein DipZ, partial [Polaromonas glacialis]|uniref:cytochrome c biogenesis protein DipZ n=1 Tax=Polaromonas glacialis TaxID=866564 RepID=UPI0004978E19